MSRKDTPRYKMRVRWANMVQRCTNPNRAEYKNYGGRGISVCDRWLKSFDAYLADVGFCPGKDLSLDRINNDGNYETGNVRWATRKQQMQNSRRKPINLIGKVFTRLTVLSLERKTNFTWWRCRCECGKEKVIRRDHLVDGSTTSCRCLAGEKSRIRILIQRPVRKHA
jgi:hypothetical protein